ncbi:MAG TPA: T9SS type A sorting domain-containing protein [Bacteroidales bacterium]|nr:T9SS type A sorting domain-containing protein [Bacteroidales bacterium]
MNKSVFIICILLISIKINAQPTSLDSTFGTFGIVKTIINAGNDHCVALAIQANGKIVAVGYTNPGTGNDFMIVRYNTNGTLDNSFGTNGVVVTQISISDDRATSLKIQSNGKIIVAGYATYNSKKDFVVVRYNTDGTLDNSFGVNGIVRTTMSVHDDNATSLNIQNDGKIVVGGNSYIYAISIARYDTSGILDNTFGINGKVITLFNDIQGNGRASLNCSSIQTNGKIIIAGSITDTMGQNFMLLRYNTDGGIDSSFGINGMVRTGFITNYNDWVNGMVIQADGKIVCVGNSSPGPHCYIAIARYNDNGTIDFHSTNYCFDMGGALSVALQNNGKIVTAGFNFSAGPYLSMTRYNTVGSPDNTFSPSGCVGSSLVNDAYGLAIQTDGKYVTCGTFYDFSLARFKGDSYNNIDELNTNFNLNIFPNPAQDYITIVNNSYDDYELLSIFSAQGQLLIQKPIRQPKSIIDVSILSRGIYFLRISNQKNEKVASFIKE